MNPEEFKAYLEQLKNEEVEDKNPIYEDLTNKYSQDWEAKQAHTTESAKKVQQLEAELSAQKARNWDLIQQVNVEPINNNVDSESSDEPKSTKDLFE